MNWIILRGLVREKRHWRDFPHQLEQELKKIEPRPRVIPLDLPGFGTEFKRKSPVSVREIVLDLRHRMNQLKNSNQNEEASSADWGIIAVSLGGMIAMEWSAHFPQDFKRVVLINSSASKISPLLKRMKIRNWPTVFRIALTKDLYKREKLILKMTTNLTTEQIDHVARIHAQFISEAKPSVRNAAAQLIAAIRFVPPQKIPVPALILSSLGDTLVDPSCSVALAEHFKAEHRIHPNGNHDLSEDAGPWIIEHIKTWAND